DLTTGRELRALPPPAGADPGGSLSVAFSPDGKYLATGGRDDESVRLWSPTTGKELRQLPGHRQGVHAVQFAPDGKLLLSQDRYLQVRRLWDVETGKQVQNRDIYGSGGLAWSKDGKTVAWGENNYGLRLWKVGTPFRPRIGHGDRVFNVKFSPDGKTL